MEDLIQFLIRLLQREFPGSVPELEQVKPLQKVGGFLIWSGFDGVEQIDRQQRLSGALKRGLDPDQRRQITTILTLTPEESALMQTE